MNTSSEISNISASVKSILSRHSARHPINQEIAKTVAGIKQIDFKPGADKAQAEILLSRLYRAVNSPIDAIEHLHSALTATNDVQLQETSLRLVNETAKELLTKKYSRQVKDASANKKVANALKQVVEVAGHLPGSAQLRIYLSLLTRKAVSAIELAKTAAQDDPRFLRDFIATINKVMARSDFASLAAQVAEAVKDLAPSLASNGYFSFLIAVRIKSQSLLVKVGRLAPVSLEEVLVFLRTAKSKDISALARDKTIFLYSYPDDEEIKLAVLRYYYSKIVKKRKNAQVAKAYLEQCAKTIRFWAHAKFQAKVIEHVSACLGDDDGPDASIVRGSILLLEQKEALAAQAYGNSILSGTLYAETGATSFYDHLYAYHRKSFTDRRADFSGVQHTDTAFVVCADVKYFERYALLYSNSLRNSGNQTRIHFHLSASSHQEALDAADKCLSGVKNVSISSESNDLKYTRMPTYYASMRFLQAPKFLKHVASRVFLTDIDVLFRVNPDEVINAKAWDAADVGFRIYDHVRVLKQSRFPHDTIYRYPRLLPWSQINAAFLALFDTERGQLIAERISDDMHRHLGRALINAKSAWWVDQNSLRKSLITIVNDELGRVVNIEDVGMPYGGFLYDGLQIMTGDLGTFKRKNQFTDEHEIV
ncbi:hypothetical protein IFT84_14120 [Rhizobium sp. CFBP 8762]|uniref:hypothetical protein n=1 Tax=Rhizobium sp. CFBP 8762 TaxID=2775279 RepID=UPI001780472B|nr:hypothetical protein [Rhizobium sp. CFBP 8762]MBD8555643.1 hypothetical protein [Rhizobium sp. CFBP 8762]